MMSINPAKFQKLALDFICQEYRKTIELKTVGHPQGGYGFPAGQIPDEWIAFFIMDPNHLHVGGANYIAIHRDTKAIRVFSAGE